MRTAHIRPSRKIEQLQGEKSYALRLLRDLVRWDATPAKGYEWARLRVIIAEAETFVASVDKRPVVRDVQDGTSGEG